MKIQQLSSRLIILALLICSASSIWAQVGVGTLSPTTTLDVNGAISIRETGTLTLVSGENNNINLGAIPVSHYKIVGPTSSFYINGVIPISGSNGQIITLENTTSSIMFLRHEYASSTTTNRLYIPGGKDLMIRGDRATITLRYDATSQRWIPINNLNRVETWYSGALVVADGISTTITVSSPGLTPNNGVAITLVGFYSTPTTDKYNIYLEYVETQTDQFIFRINNTNPDTQPGPNYSAVQLQYAYTIVK